MEEKVYKILSQNKIENTLNFPYWLYQTEMISVAGRRFLKVYFVDRTYGEKTLDEVCLLIGNTEKTINTFSVISEYNDMHYVGGVAELSEGEEFSDSIQIISETVGGEKIERSGKKVTYEHSWFPKDNAYLMQKLPLYEKYHSVYPQINEDYWQCSCGRIHSCEETTCACGQTIKNIKEILEFDFNENHAQDYLKNPMPINPGLSFEENLDKYLHDFAMLGCDPEVLKKHLDLDVERQRYDEFRAAKELSEKREAARKKKIRLTLITAVLLIVGSFVGIKYVLPAVRYSSAERALQQQEFERSIALYEKLGDYKDSSDKINEAKYKNAVYLADQNQFDESISIFEYLSKLPYSDSKVQIDTTKLKKAQYLYNQGKFKDAADILEDLRKKGGSFAEVWQQSTYKYAVQMKDSKQYEEAKNSFIAVKSYQDSKQLLSDLCKDYVKQLYEEKNFKEAIDCYKYISDVDSSDVMYLESHYWYGRSLLDDKKYQDGIRVLEKVKNFSDTATYINEGKYLYVKNHRKNTDRTTYTYLKDLRAIGYKDTNAIYNNLYKLTCSIIINGSKSNTTSKSSSISPYSALYVHYKLGGGTPDSGNNVNLNFSFKFPDGATSSDSAKAYKGSWSWFGWTSGLYYRGGGYTPRGTFTVTIYDSNWNYLASSSVNIR